MEVPITLVSVCYNHSPYLIDSLESIRKQTFQEFQWIIIDDCSTDDSQEKIACWIKERGIACTYLPHQKNVGLCASLNEALRLSRGKYFAMCSTDDLLEPKKLEIQYREIEALPENVGVLYSDARLIDETGQILKKTHHEKFFTSKEFPSGRIYLPMLRGNFLAVAATLTRMSCFEKVGRFDEELSYEDWDMWLRISLHYEFAVSSYMSSVFRVKETPDWHPFSKANAEKYYDTNTKTLAKCPNSKLLSKKERLATLKVIHRHAIRGFVAGRNKRKDALRTALRYRFSPILFACYLFHCCTPRKLELQFMRKVHRIYWKLWKKRPYLSRY